MTVVVFPGQRSASPAWRRWLGSADATRKVCLIRLEEADEHAELAEALRRAACALVLEADLSTLLRLSIERERHLTEARRIVAGVQKRLETV